MFCLQTSITRLLYLIIFWEKATRPLSVRVWSAVWSFQIKQLEEKGVCDGARGGGGTVDGAKEAWPLELCCEDRALENVDRR